MPTTSRWYTTKENFIWNEKGDYKLTIKLMRITIKYLQEQLENEKAEKTKYYRLWRELDDEKKNDMNMKLNSYMEKEEKDIRENITLLRIIDSLINPDILVKEIEIQKEYPNFRR